MPTINPLLLPTPLFYYRSKSNSSWNFSGVCGYITFVKMAGDNNHQTRFAFIEFEKRESVKTAVDSCNGIMLGDRAIKSVT